MTNKQTRNFTRSDDALILEQPVSRVGLNILATMPRTSQERVMRRADELGVVLAISDDQHEAIDTRALRCSNGLVDPLLERLKQVHGDRKKHLPALPPKAEIARCNTNVYKCHKRTSPQ